MAETKSKHGRAIRRGLSALALVAAMAAGASTVTAGEVVVERMPNVGSGGEGLSAKAAKAWNWSEEAAREAWDKTREVSAGTWEKTREVSEETWEKTKQVSEETWEKTKVVSEEGWEKTKEVSGKTWDRTRAATGEAIEWVTGGDDSSPTDRSGVPVEEKRIE